MQINNLKIAFFGTSDFAVPTFKKLIQDGCEISAVFAGQGPIKSLAQERGIKISPLEDLESIDFDIGIVVAYGKIIPEKYLRIPQYGFINIHPSLLPKYRGPSPIQAAILNGDEEAGVSIMVVDKDMDHGPVLDSKPYRILHTTYYPQAEKELAELGADMLLETLPKYISGEIKPQEQDHSKATFTKLITREDGRIDWNLPAEKIYNQIRALNPEPGTWTKWNGKILNIKSAEPLVRLAMSDTPGTVVNTDGLIAVATGSDYLILKTVQLEGKKETDIKSLLNGYPGLLNSKLDS